MVGDPAGGDTFEDCLNKMLAKSAYICDRDPPVEPGTFGRWSEFTWHDGSPLDPAFRDPGAPAPPLRFEWSVPEGQRSFYTSALKKEFAKTFTEPGSPGIVYRGEFERLERALRLPERAGGHGCDARLSKDGVHHFLLPAFFRTLADLCGTGRQFVLVVRTFGSDGPDVAEAVNAWAEGAHPSVPAAPGVSIPPENLWVTSFSEDGQY